ncbi:DUF3231 family protein [Caldalkalibacillus mannanilyticus]|uniref:DUF3231 family protein n=1 Tax=Caldalkalibacillus mannanilyticus TaxID=1418 RepID=UPI000ACDB073|nr:DUF3231 family protein [Caldalkalibacillus mannanilyticus]
MMSAEHRPKLTSAEMANLWTSYQNDTAAICVFHHFLATVEDKETREILEYALHLSQQHVKTLKEIMEGDHFPIPLGFSEQDVNVSAPRLFSDEFYLSYMKNLAQIGVSSNSMAQSNSSRSDIRKFYTKCSYSSAELLNKIVSLLQRKGIYIRPPYIPVPTQVEFVHKQSFLTGWFGDRRPLNTVEIMNLFFNLQRNAIGNSLFMGFAQVAKSDEIQSYFQRGKEIAIKHMEIFSSILKEDDLPAAQTWDTEVSSSTISPFSDKLMMFHALSLNSTGIGYYGISMGTSQRRDLGMMYARLMTEVTQYAEDGANIMINHSWLEQPPTAPDRAALVKN